MLKLCTTVINDYIGIERELFVENFSVGRSLDIIGWVLSFCSGNKKRNPEVPFFKSISKPIKQQ